MAVKCHTHLCSGSFVIAIKRKPKNIHTNAIFGILHFITNISSTRIAYFSRYGFLKTIENERCIMNIKCEFLCGFTYYGLYFVFIDRSFQVTNNSYLTP